MTTTTITTETAAITIKLLLGWGKLGGRGLPLWAHDAEATKMADEALSKASGKQTTGIFGGVCIAVQAFLLACFGAATYDTSELKKLDASSLYNFYVGVALMMFVGFGYLMTFLQARDHQNMFWDCSWKRTH